MRSFCHTTSEVIAHFISIVEVCVLWKLIFATSADQINCMYIYVLYVYFRSLAQALLTSATWCILREFISSPSSTPCDAPAYATKVRDRCLRVICSLCVHENDADTSHVKAVNIRPIRAAPRQQREQPLHIGEGTLQHHAALFCAAQSEVAHRHQNNAVAEAFV